MKFEHLYKIPFVGLKVGLHRFHFKIDDEFFANFEDSQISGSKISIDVEFDKKMDFFLVKFFVSGFISSTCDRCALQYQQELMDDFKVYFKFEDRSPELSVDDEEVIFISRNDTHINVGQLIYDFVHLSLPIKMICEKNRNNDEFCNQEMKKYFDKKVEPEEIDQRWSALKKIKK